MRAGTENAPQKKRRKRKRGGKKLTIIESFPTSSSGPIVADQRVKFLMSTNKMLARWKLSAMDGALQGWRDSRRLEKTSVALGPRVWSCSMTLAGRMFRRRSWTG
jgi:hypothetical protein